MNEPASLSPVMHCFANAGDLIAALANKIVARLTDGVRRNHVASFVASGGTTPGVLFDALAEREAPWERIFVTSTDERWVPPGDDRSNEKLLRTRLLHGHAASAALVPFKTQHASPAEAERDVGRAVAAMPRPFDVTLLGMGNDGHTASLFPGAEGLAEALDLSSPALVRAITPANVAETGLRISLTLRAILDSKTIVVLIRGDEKLKTYRTAIAGTDVTEMPIRAVLLQSAVPVEIYWAP